MKHIYVIKIATDMYLVSFDENSKEVRTVPTAVEARWFDTYDEVIAFMPGARVVALTITERDV